MASPFWFPDPPAPGTPQITVYALTGVAGAAYYSRVRNTIAFFNAAYYGQLKSWVLGAVGRVLAAEYGIHSIHGACVSRDGSGILYIAPTGTGKSTSSYGLMAERGTRFHSDDWVYVRYTYRHRYGGRVLPVAVRSGSGEEVCGLRVYRWIDSHPEDGDALVTARTLMGKEFTAENFPLAAGQLLRAKLESVPHVGGAFLAGQASTLDVMEAAVGGRSRGLDGTARRVALARPIAFDNGRPILALGRILERGRAFSNPMEPLRLGSVFLLKRDFASDAVLQRLQLPSFMARLLLGETPAGTREVAYNAYRAADDAAEGTCVTALEAEVRAAGEPVTTQASTRASLSGRGCRKACGRSSSCSASCTGRSPATT